MPDANVPNEQAAHQKLDQISAKVATRGLELPSQEELCQIYKSVKPLIDDVLPWIRHLPKGDKIADAIVFLEKIADRLCA